ncbi:MAG: VanZ family protein [Planctomycetes bacterium]|nr:VanZ family protein [Planctomycetota bacterium]
MDKPVHFLAYGIITFLFVISLKKSPTVLSVLFVFLAISVIGAVDELTQPFVGRTASIVDLAADILGIFTILLVSTVRRRRSLRLHP